MCDNVSKDAFFPFYLIYGYNTRISNSYLIKMYKVRWL